MSRVILASSALVLALLASPPAFAASDADLVEIRAQIKDLRESYEARIHALEERLRSAEAVKANPVSPPATDGAAARAGPVPLPSSAASSLQSAMVSAGGSSSGIAAFNPAISVVLQGTYANLSRDPARYRIQNYALSDEVTPGKRGSGLGESELAFSANVDDKFAAKLIVSLTPENTVSVEEAYGLYTAAPYGLAPKFGRFFSGVGYLNEQHQHVWDFYDAPLAYQAFLGGQYGNDGAQLKWVAPTDEFLELGVEIGNGTSFPGTDRNKNGIGSAAVYAHTGGDVGASHSWRAGLSYLDTRASDREWSTTDALGNDARLGFDGKSHLAVADAIWKWAPNGNAHDTNVKIQGEYFWRRERGDLSYDHDGAPGITQTSAYSARQSGGYLQGVYQFMPYWRTGARYDWLSGRGVDYGNNAANLERAPFNPQRYTLMIDYTPSEFSRFRLQLAQSKTQADVTDNQVFLQYILTIGAHGAHRF